MVIRDDEKGLVTMDRDDADYYAAVVRRDGVEIFRTPHGTPEDMLLSAYNQGLQAGMERGRREMVGHIILKLEELS